MLVKIQIILNRSPLSYILNVDQPQVFGKDFITARNGFENICDDFIDLNSFLLSKDNGIVRIKSSDNFNFGSYMYLPKGQEVILKKDNVILTSGHSFVTLRDSGTVIIEKMENYNFIDSRAIPVSKNVKYTIGNGQMCSIPVNDPLLDKTSFSIQYMNNSTFTVSALGDKGVYYMIKEEIPLYIDSSYYILIGPNTLCEVSLEKSKELPEIVPAANAAANAVTNIRPHFKEFISQEEIINPW